MSDATSTALSSDAAPSESVSGNNSLGAKGHLRIPLGVADMAMYAAIVGKVPEIDPNAPAPMELASHAVRENPWSPIVLSIYLREIYRQSTLKLNKPEIAAWIKKQSEIARKRFAETQVRIAHVRNDRAA